MIEPNNQLTIFGNNNGFQLSPLQVTQNSELDGETIDPMVKGITENVFDKSKVHPTPQLTHKSLNDLKKCILKLNPLDIQLQPERLNIIALKKLDSLSKNLVYEVDVPFSTIAYFKIGKENAEGTASLEQLMWKVSKIMGIKDNLVRTKTIQLSFAETDALMKGSIQPAVTGVLLKRFFSINDCAMGHVSDKELSLAIFTSHIMGMFDAHASNIMITPEGKIKFFDNALSLPNGNGLISMGACTWSVRSAYRCALLDVCERVSKILDSDTRNELLEKARYCKQQLGSLNDYFDSESGKMITDKLPEGWLNRRGMIVAMEQRIDLMIDQLVSHKQLNILELVVGNNFLYKLTFAVNFVAVKSKTFSMSSTRQEFIESGKHAHVYVNSLLFMDHFKLLNKFGYSLDRLVDICDDAPNFPELINRIVEGMFEKRIENDQQNSFGNFEVFTNISHTVPYDQKEKDPSIYAKRVIQDFNKNSLRELGFKLHLCDNFTHTYFNIDEKKFILYNVDDRSMRLCIWTDIGLRVKKISLDQKKGEVQVIRGTQIVSVPLAELENEMSEVNGEPIMKEFPAPFPEMQKLGLFKADNDIQITQYAENLYIFFTNKDGKVNRNLIPSNDTHDRFIVNNVSITFKHLIVSFLKLLRESKK